MHQKPTQPILVNLVQLQSKGCQSICHILNSKIITQFNLSHIENKWHKDLNVIIGVETWDKYRTLYSKIKYLNNLKWLQYQIIHRYVKTNKVISHFIPNIIDICTFCRFSSETIEHLFYTCHITTSFIVETSAYIRSFYLNFTINKLKFLFGDINRDIMDPENLIVLVMKGYIWCTKFRKLCPNLSDFKIYLKFILENLKLVHDLNNNCNLFSEHFDIIYLSLIQELQI